MLLSAAPLAAPRPWPDPAAFWSLLFTMLLLGIALGLFIGRRFAGRVFDWAVLVVVCAFTGVLLWHERANLTAERFAAITGAAAAWCAAIYAAHAISRQAEQTRITNTLTVLHRLESEDFRKLRAEVNAFVDETAQLDKDQWEAARELLNGLEDVAVAIEKDCIDGDFARASLEDWVRTYWGKLSPRAPAKQKREYTALKALYEKWNS